MRRAMSGVSGHLLHWAREQQDLKMRWIHQNGGPSPAYQSEVETGKKVQVLVDMLSRWTDLLGVTEAFARGQIPKYHLDPAACRGLAAEVAVLVSASSYNWADATEQERVREVLRLMAWESRKVPRVVLAWVLDLDLRTLDDLIAGVLPIMLSHMKAAAHLTTIAETFFQHGPSAQFEQYVPVFHRASELGITPQTLMQLIDQHQNAEASAHRAGRVKHHGPLGVSERARDQGE